MSSFLNQFSTSNAQINSAVNINQTWFVDQKVSKAVWFVNGRPMPSPKTIGWSLQDLQAPGSGRLLDGNMHSEFVCQKRKIEITYNNSDTAIFNEALRAVSGGGYRQVTYWDLLDWNWRTSTMYVSDRSGITNHFLPDRIITGELSFSMVEV